jgi:hypothetical protein
MEKYLKKPERDPALQTIPGTTWYPGALATGGGFKRRELIAGKLARSVPGRGGHREVFPLFGIEWREWSNTFVKKCNFIAFYVKHMHA